MKVQPLGIFLWLIYLTAASGQDTIAYSSGPSFQIPLEFARSIDLNEDTTDNFSFWSSRPICTMDYPSSFCLWPYHIGASGTNQMLIAGYDAFLQSLGAGIGSNVPLGAAWATPGWPGAGLAAYWWSRYGQVTDGELIYSGWSGALGELGVAYLGLRFHAADGPHYGWVRVRLPRPHVGVGLNLFEYALVVVDWAYETCPDAPIRAGDIGSGGESVQFTVEWSSPRHMLGNSDQNVGTGSFILTGNTLRGELTLAGQVSSAQVIGPGNHGKKANPVLDFGGPLVARSSHTAFFGEATLTHPQILKLLHGKYCVTANNGALAGQIVTATPAP